MLASKIGVGDGTVARVMCGGRPKVEFVRRMAALEGAYAGEIEALRRGDITVGWRKGAGIAGRVDRRVDWRPKDRAALGGVDAEGGGDGRRNLGGGAGDAVRAFKVVRIVVKGRVKRKKD